MGDKSSIQWLVDENGRKGATWNPIKARKREGGKVGWFCIHHSSGCIGCYAELMNLWRGNGIEYKAQNLEKVEIFLDGKTLLQPIGWKAGRRIFPCSMTDLFGDFVEDEWIYKMLAVMTLTPQHTYLVLTKRAERMRVIMKALEHDRSPLEAAARAIGYTFAFEGTSLLTWPRSNIWAGVSIEDQGTAEERIGLLRAAPAARRWISLEPQIAPVDLRLFGLHIPVMRIDLIVQGGHSGAPGVAKDFRLSWARDVQAYCREVGVAYFLKQLGSSVIDDITRPNTSFAIKTKDKKGGEIAEWPLGLQVRQWPVATRG